MSANICRSELRVVNNLHRIFRPLFVHFGDSRKLNESLFRVGENPRNFNDLLGFRIVSLSCVPDSKSGEVHSSWGFDSPLRQFEVRLPIFEFRIGAGVRV